MVDRRRSEYHIKSLRVFVYSEIALWARRYISKIIFTAILGYNVDVGHMEAVNLISSPKYSEKQIVSSTCAEPFVSKEMAS